MKLGRERGSVTILAITAMLVLAAGAASYSYVTSRNTEISTKYANGLQAQYSAEAAVKTFYVVGRVDNTIAKLNDYVSDTNTYNLTLPGAMGTAQGTIKSTSTANIFNVEAVATFKDATRRAYNSSMDFSTTSHTTETLIDTTTVSNIADLIKAGSKWDSSSGLTSTVGYGNWTATTDSAGNSVILSPGYNSNWASISSKVLFNDTLGLSSYSPTATLSLMYRVNYYVTLNKVPASASGTGYGIYYLAKKTSADVAGNASNVTAYVVQFDPGLNPSYSVPSGFSGWGAARSSDTSTWPYGAFLVKKVVSANEVWDENSGSNYNIHYGFQDNNELTQRYDNSSGYIQPSLTATNLISSSNSSSWALQPASTTPGTAAPTVTQVPTAFGYSYAANSTGTFSTELTGNYRARPPDLRIAYTLGNLAEGNPWQPKTYYPVGSKVAVGVWVDKALSTRMVWVATQAGVSSGISTTDTTAKPTLLKSVPASGTTVVDGSVIWTAKLAPTPAEVAKAILSYQNTAGTSRFSIAKTSMSDLKFRVDTVNGSTADITNTYYSMPFAMIQGNKNKTTIELWADNLGNRVHVIRVNDVVVLGFNDRSGKVHDIIPEKWELTPTADPRSTGIRVWNAAAAFYTAENYGQTTTQTTTQTTSSNYGFWGK